ncbi:MAG: molybdate ABC transporter substrate-binding protein [Methanomicrobium sp.]|nr:molybdate ABC transporter substrate-binding protein [Methanomicrobium sp.]
MMKNSGYAILIPMIIFSVFFCGCTGDNSPGKSGAEDKQQASEKVELLVYCGAGMKTPMEEIGAAYKEKTGNSVTYTYAGSGQLLSQMDLTQKGDIYMPGATTDFSVAKDKGYIADEALIAYHVPVIAVPKGNPAQIKSLNDMANPGVKISSGDSKSMALGIIAKNIFRKNGIEEEAMSNVVVARATVNEIVTDIVLGNADAAIIWEDLYKPENMEIVYIPDEQNLIKIVPIGTLSFSKQPLSAKEFLDFVASDEGGKAIFKKNGFTPYPDEKYNI